MTENVIIIGAGASAVSLCQAIADAGTAATITVIGPRASWYRGTAYGVGAREHLLNVVAGNMSIRPHMPTDFVDFLRIRADYTDTDDKTLAKAFLPRRVFGDYLEACAQRATEQLTANGGSILWIDATVTNISLEKRVTLDNGQTLDANDVIVATGNQLPAAPWLQPTAQISTAWQAQPWQLHRNVIKQTTLPIVLIGAGLTMVDSYLELRARDVHNPILAISRHGLPPLAHTQSKHCDSLTSIGINPADFAAQMVSAKRLTAQCTLAFAVLRQLREIGCHGAPLATALRPVISLIWQQWTLREKQRFVRHLTSRWNQLRHLVPEVLMEQLAALELHAGWIESISVTNDADSLSVNYRLRDGEQCAIRAALVINCTGPQLNLGMLPQHPLHNLLQEGKLAADPLGLGITVDVSTLEMLSTDGTKLSGMYALGALLRGTLWECTSIPDIRDQAALISKHLGEKIEARSAVNPPAPDQGYSYDQT